MVDIILKRDEEVQLILLMVGAGLVVFTRYVLVVATLWERARLDAEIRDKYCIDLGVD